MCDAQHQDVLDSIRFGVSSGSWAAHSELPDTILSDI